MRDTSQSSQDSAENRFHHLLQPIRNLANNWNIDIASELEEYLDELEQLRIDFEGGEVNLNFAEAALLIQGTACIYSKKVEYLYALVYQTLDLLAENKAHKGRQPEQNHGDAGDLEQDTVEFLNLDDVLEEAKNIDLKDDRELLHRKVTPGHSTSNSRMSRLSIGLMGSLLPDDRGDTFKMNTCTVHQSGALLLDILPGSNYDQNLEPISTNLQEPHSSASQDEANGFPEEEDGHEAHIGGGESSEDEETEDFPAPAFSSPIQAETSEQANAQRAFRALHAPGVSRLSMESRKEVEEESDPFEMLDPYDEGKSVIKPFKKGKTFKAPALLNDPECGTNGSLYAHFFWGSVQTATDIKIRLKAQSSEEDDPMAFTVVDIPLKGVLFKEFQGLAQRERKRRMAEKIASRNLQVPGATGAMEEDYDDDDNDNYGPDDDDDDGGDNGFAAFPSADFDGGEGRIGGESRDTEGGCVPISLDEAFREVPESYEDLCRSHIEKFMRGADQYLKETNISKRVAEWQEKLIPVLEEQERTPAFDIHEYGDQIVHRIEDRIARRQAESSKKVVKEKTLVPFAEVVTGKQVKDICRMFLATLQLANNGNVNLIHANSAPEPQSFGLKLLSSQKLYDIAGYAAPSMQATRASQ